MVYRLGEQARFYRVRRAWRRQCIQSTTLVVLCMVLVGLVMMRMTRNSFVHALGIGGKRTTQASIEPASKPKHTTGSSAPVPKGTPSTSVKADTASAPLDQSGCNVFPAMHPGLTDSSAPELRKLAQYERLCNGAVAARTSFFVPTPSTSTQAQSLAQSTAAKLKAYAQAGISPLIFMEPTDPDDTQLDLTEYAGGTYDTALTAYFQALQTAGVTAEDMGMWVYLPEGNTPVWSTSDPNVYTGVVTKMARMQKQHFPGSQVSIMLDSQSYHAGSSWGSGSYVSLAPYVQNIPQGLIDSFGLQGFPWAAPANQSGQGSLYNPDVYLRVDYAEQAARILGTANIWFNTGTFAQMYTGQQDLTVTDTPLQRQEILDGVVQLAKRTQEQGFNVAIHLFAQNKANLPEGTDWSYWLHTPGDSPDSAVFTTFADNAHSVGIPLWLFDTD